MSDTPTPANVRTWADGFNRWHASVPATGDPQADAETALAAIVDELTPREGPNFDPTAVRVKYKEVTGDRVVYAELVRDECDECGECIPDGPPDEVNAHHAPTCSLFPGLTD